MSQTLLDSEQDAYDLQASSQTVLEYTQDSSVPTTCKVKLAVGDDDNPLDGTGGEFTVVVTVDGVNLYGYPLTLTIAASTEQIVWESEPFTADEGAEIAVTLLSPNAADSDVGVYAYLYGQDVSATYEDLSDHNANAVKICNMALGQLGELSGSRRLTNFTRTAAGDSPILNACLDFYEAAKKLTLTVRHWPFALKTKALTVSDNAPFLENKWTYKYARPADCLLLLKVIDDGGTEYAWERMAEERSGTIYNDDYIFTDLEDAIGLYLFNVGEERYPPGIDVLHSLYLAEMIAMTVTEKERTSVLMLQKLEQRKNALIALAESEAYIAEEGGRYDVTEVF
ncbi:MAG: hypothetical protein M0R06_06055 [Sphaerochaeta sp.]|jgi:hypothetical protein|nr:hypothetical protein [Sphaerochaeta sp.]